jgi:hypothetical protein
MFIALFLTHVGSLTTLRNNQRRFAPTPAHITGIKCPHHRNKHRKRHRVCEPVPFAEPGQECKSAFP